MSKYKAIRKSIKDAKDKDLVGVFLVRKKQKKFVSEFVFPTDPKDALMVLNALGQQFKYLKDQLEKEGIIEDIKDAMYG